MKTALALAALLFTAVAAADTPKVVDVGIPIGAYMEGLQNEGVQELPSIVVFKPNGDCLGIIDTAKTDEIAPQFERIVRDGVIKCSVTMSKHFDKTGTAQTPAATVHLQLVLLEASVCTLCPGYIDEVQKIVDSRTSARLVVVRVRTR
jgi:hypothetical protein